MKEKIIILDSAIYLNIHTTAKLGKFHISILSICDNTPGGRKAANGGGGGEGEGSNKKDI